MAARNRILETADRLFYERGINATGIDLIIAEAGVAKATLYAHFASKEQLVAKYLERIRVQFEIDLAKADEKVGGSVFTPFKLLEESLITGHFYGCPFTNALTELPESALVRSEVEAYREVVAAFFSKHAPVSAIAALLMVYDGAFTSCKFEPSKRHIDTAITIAKSILQDAMTESALLD